MQQQQSIKNHTRPVREHGGMSLTDDHLKTISKVKQAWEDWQASEPDTPEQVQADHHWKASAEMLAHMLFSTMEQKETLQ